MRTFWNILIKRAVFLLLLTVAFLLGFHSLVNTFGSSTTFGLSKRPSFVPGRLLVKLRPGYKINSLESLNAEVGVSKVRTTLIERLYDIYIPSKSDVLSIVNRYQALPCVEYASPYHLYYPAVIPNDPYFSLQWGLNQATDADIDAPEAWDIHTGSSSIKIGIIDTGVDPNHPDLASNLESGYDFVDEDSAWWAEEGITLVGDYKDPDDDPSDEFGHGTMSPVSRGDYKYTHPNRHRWCGLEL